MGTDCLKRRARQIEAEAAVLRRHDELIEWAVEELGLERRFAETVYEVARQESVDPAIAFELIRCNVGVRDDAAKSGAAPSLQSTPPDWIAAAPPPDEAHREWRLRTSVRRLRSLLETAASPGDALIAFANASDVDEESY